MNIEKKIQNLTYGKFKGLNGPLHNVLLQEIIRIQSIIELVNKSLVDIREAVDGKLMMTEDIVKSIDALYASRPPNIWMYNANGEEISWISQTASSWFDGLITRSKKLREWLNIGPNRRPFFYLPGFLNPQGFFAAFKQEAFKMKREMGGQNSNITLNLIVLNFNPDKNETDPEKFEMNMDKRKDKDLKGTHYMYVYGLYIEGALWNGSLLDDPDTNSRNTIILFPIILVTGDVESNKQLSSNVFYYNCPVYKYPKRTDKYFIIDIMLRTASGDQDQKFWQKRGVAMLSNKE